MREAAKLSIALWHMCIKQPGIFYTLHQSDTVARFEFTGNIVEYQSDTVALQL